MRRERRPVDERLQVLPHPEPWDTARPPSRRSEAIGARAVGAQAIAALAVGAVAIGAVAIGALAIGRLAIGRTRIRLVEIDELVVRRLRITDELQVPDAAASSRASSSRERS